MINLIQGEALRELSKIPDSSVDAVICDIPYGTTACKWDTVIPFLGMWNELDHIIKPRGAVVLFGSQPFTSLLIKSNILNFKFEIIWHKNQGSNFALTKYMPMKEHENIIVFGKGKIKYNPIMQDRALTSQKRLKYKLTEYKGDKRDFINGMQDNNKNMKYDESKRVTSSVQFFPVVPRYKGTLHPNQKPVDLMEFLVKMFTDEGDTILDFAMGSGSTGIACLNQNRSFIGIEKDDKYFKIAQARIDAWEEEVPPKPRFVEPTLF